MSLQRVLAVFFRYFYVLRKGPQQLSDLFYWPIIDILLWGLTSVWINSMNGAVPRLPLMMMTALIFQQIIMRGSFDISLSVMQEFWHRNLVNLFSTPLKIREWVAGVILMCFFKLCISISFCSLAIYILYSLNVFTIGFLFIPFAIALLLFGWTLGFLAASLIIYWGNHVEAIAWMIGFLFAPFSAVFYPVHVLPTWAQNISWCLPTTYIFEGMRSIFTTGSFPTTYFWTAIGLDILYLSLTITLFNIMFEKSRVKGLARLE